MNNYSFRQDSKNYFIKIKVRQNKKQFQVKKLAKENKTNI